jgi:hypothetical protein
MAQIFSMGMSEQGVEISVNYNAANLRVTTVDWTIPQSGIVARVRIWDAGISVYDRTIGGPASGTENVPGNIRVVQVNEGGEVFFDLPANITWSINIETIGS